MPTSSSRRRVTTSLFIGAVLGLTALAMPSAASAAEACVTAPTAATQPWATFAELPNVYVDYEALYATFPPAVIDLLETVDADFTQTELDALNASVGGLFTSISTQGQAIGDQIEAQKTSLVNALLAIDPASGPATDAIFDGFNDEIDASQYGAPVQTAFTGGITAIGTYLQSVQDAITASTPRPAVTSATTDPVAAIAASIGGFGDYVGGVVYGGAAALVIYEETCPAALAATGSSDPTPIAGGAAMLLLLGTGLVIARRRAHEAA